MKNNLSDLNNHLFSMLEALEDDELMQDKETAERTIQRAKAMSQVSAQIIRVANVQLQALKTAENCGLLQEEMPALVAVKDSAKDNKTRQKLLEVTKCQ